MTPQPSLAMKRSLPRRSIVYFDDCLYHLLITRSPLAYRIGAGCLLLLVLATVILLIIAGPAPQRDCPADAILYLDGAIRIVCGQRPHVDFYSPLGFTSFVPAVLGIFVCGRDIAALACGVAVLLPPITLCAWAIARPRFPAFTTTLFAAFSGGLTIATFPLGFRASWRWSSYQMQYNRLEWSLLGILFVAAYVMPRRPLSRIAAYLEGGLVGILGAALICSKPNYALLAILVLATGGLWRSLGRSYWTGILAALTACLAMYLIYLRGDVAAIGRDYWMLAHAQRASDRLHDILMIVRRSWPELLLPAFIALIHLRRFAWHGFPIRGAGAWWRGIVLAAVLFPVGFALTATNAQYYDVPFWALACVILAETFRKRARVPAGPEFATRQEHGAIYRLRVSLGCVAAAWAILSFVVPDFISVPYALVWKKLRSADVPPDAKFESRLLQGMFCPPCSIDPANPSELRPALETAHGFLRGSPMEYAIVVNDGLRLLKKHVNQDSRIYTLDYINPFPVALNLQPPKGSPWAWHYGRFVNEKCHPPASVVFGEVTHLMVSKSPKDSDASAHMHRIFDDYIKKNFVLLDESAMWSLYVRIRVMTDRSFDHGKRCQ